MGLYRETHLKPFIRIPVPYEEEEVLIYTCGVHLGNKVDLFCSKCGSPMKKQTTPKKTPLSVQEILENDNLWDYTDGETMWILSNIHSEFDVNTDDGHMNPITPELITNAIEVFKEIHEEDIKEIEKKIGYPVVVEFGLINIVS